MICLECCGVVCCFSHSIILVTWDCKNVVYLDECGMNIYMVIIY